MIAMLVKSLAIVTILAISSTCGAKKPTQKAYHHGKHKKSSLQQEEKIKTATQPERYENIVNLDWVKHYDELLSKYGDKLNPPRQPGDRDGIEIEGANDRVSSDALKRYEQLKHYDEMNTKTTR